MRRAVCMSCVLVLMLGGHSARLQAGEAKAKSEAKSKAKVAVVRVKGSLPESSGQLGLFGELEQNLSQLMERLDRAAKDKEVTAVVLEVRNPDIGRGRLHELRAAVGRIRKAGKRVVALLETADSTDYLLASACDEIVMPESGVVMIPGVRAEVTHYKGALDKLGIEADMMQMGDYKGAAEPFTRNEMSPEFRKQFELVLDDLYAQLVETISADRKLDPSKVRGVIDVGLVTAVEARNAGLIDKVAYGDQLQNDLKKQLSVEEVSLIQDYGKRKVEDDFSGILGMARLFNLMMGLEPSRGTTAGKKVAVVYASGMIMPGKSLSGLLGEMVGSETIVKALRDADQDKSVVAIVLRVDSPGGSALASDLIWRAVRQCEKPLVASMGDMAASGGYYISMGCDKIYAEAGTLTGSIGVVGGKLAIGRMFDKIGIHTDVIARGQNSGLVSSESRFTDSERAAWKKMMEDIYRQFVSKAAEGRKMEVAQLTNLAGGRIWTGRQAKQNRLVDEVGSLQDAVDAARKLAGLSADEKTELLILPRPRSVFEELLGGDLSVGTAAQTQLEQAAPGLTRVIRQAASLPRLFAEPVLLVLPYQVVIR